MKTIKPYFVTGIVALFTCSTFAWPNQVDNSSCQTVEEIDSILGPNRNQRDKGWCFANTAADLITHAYSKEINKNLSSLQGPHISPARKQVSNMFTAVNFYNTSILENSANTDQQIFGEAGFVVDAIDAVQKQGFICDQSFDENLMARGLTTSSLKEKLDYFSDLYLSYNTYWSLKNQLGENHPEAKASYDEVFKKASHLVKTNSVLNDFDRLRIETALQKNTLRESVIDIVKVVCQDRAVPINTKIKFNQIFQVADKPGLSYSKKEQKDLYNFDYIRVIDSELNRKKPVGIAYLLEDITSDPKFGTGYHASVISARKFQNGKCMYQIRNSWGNVCTQVKLIDHTGKVLDEEKMFKYHCDSGNIWVDKENLRSIVKEVTYQMTP